MLNACRDDFKFSERIKAADIVASDGFVSGDDPLKNASSFWKRAVEDALPRAERLVDTDTEEDASPVDDEVSGGVAGATAATDASLRQ